MSILDHGTARVQSDYHTSEPTPAEALACTLDQAEAWVAEPAPRYVVRARHFTSLGRDAWEVFDRAEERLVYWNFSRRECEARCTDLIAEDWPDLGRWWEVQAPSEALDRPVKLSRPGQARADRTIDHHQAEAAYPSF